MAPNTVAGLDHAQQGEHAALPRKTGCSSCSVVRSGGEAGPGRALPTSQDGLTSQDGRVQAQPRSRVATRLILVWRTMSMLQSMQRRHRWGAALVVLSGVLSLYVCV